MALVVKRVDPRTRWLAFFGCLVHVVNIVGSRVFLLATDPDLDSVGEIDVYYDVVNLVQGLIALAGTALIVLAVVVAVTARRRYWPAG